MGQRIRWLAVLGLLLPAARVVWADSRALFSSRDSLEREIVRLIDISRSTIDMALFQFASRPLARALTRARARGVLIRLVLDANQPMGRTRQETERVLALGDVRWSKGKGRRGRGFMHHKFALFDQERVTTGSFNWTPGAEHVNFENAILTDDPEVVSAYASEFDRLWRQSRLAPGRSTFWQVQRESRGRRGR